LYQVLDLLIINKLLWHIESVKEIFPVQFVDVHLIFDVKVLGGIFLNLIQLYFIFWLEIGCHVDWVISVGLILEELRLHVESFSILFVKFLYARILNINSLLNGQ
jgi:hypothetical protein